MSQEQATSQVASSKRNADPEITQSGCPIGLDIGLVLRWQMDRCR